MIRKTKIAFFITMLSTAAIFILSCIAFVILAPKGTISNPFLAIALFAIMILSVVLFSVFPSILETWLLAKLFSNNSKIELSVNWKNMGHDFNKLSEKEKKIFKECESTPVFLQKKENIAYGGIYYLLITCGNIQYLIHDSNKKLNCYWMFDFDKYYTIK